MHRQFLRPSKQRLQRQQTGKLRYLRPQQVQWQQQNAHPQSMHHSPHSPRQDAPTTGSGPEHADQCMQPPCKPGATCLQAKSHDDAVLSCAFAPPPADLLATASADASIRLWSSDGVYIGQFVGHAGAVSGVTFAHAGTLLVSSSTDRTVRVWCVATHRQTSALALAGTVTSVSAVPPSPRSTGAQRSLVLALQGTACHLLSVSRSNSLVALSRFGS